MPRTQPIAVLEILEPVIQPSYYAMHNKQELINLEQRYRNQLENGRDHPWLAHIAPDGIDVAVAKYIQTAATFRSSEGGKLHLRLLDPYHTLPQHAVLCDLPDWQRRDLASQVQRLKYFESLRYIDGKPIDKHHPTLYRDGSVCAHCKAQAIKLGLATLRVLMPGD